MVWCLSLKLLFGYFFMKVDWGGREGQFIVRTVLSGSGSHHFPEAEMKRRMFCELSWHLSGVGEDRSGVSRLLTNMTSHQPVTSYHIMKRSVIIANQWQWWGPWPTTPNNSQIWVPWPVSRRMKMFFHQHAYVVRTLLCAVCTVIGNIPWRVWASYCHHYYTIQARGREPSSALL